MLMKGIPIIASPQRTKSLLLMFKTIMGDLYVSVTILDCALFLAGDSSNVIDVTQLQLETSLRNCHYIRIVELTVHSYSSDTTVPFFSPS